MITPHFSPLYSAHAIVTIYCYIMSFWILINRISIWHQDLVQSFPDAAQPWQDSYGSLSEDLNLLKCYIFPWPAVSPCTSVFSCYLCPLKFLSCSIFQKIWNMPSWDFKCLFAKDFRVSFLYKDFDIFKEDLCSMLLEVYFIISICLSSWRGEHGALLLLLSCSHFVIQQKAKKLVADFLWLLANEYCCCKFQFLLASVIAYLMLLFVVLAKVLTAENHYTYAPVMLFLFVLYLEHLLKFLKPVLMENNG